MRTKNKIIISIAIAIGTSLIYIFLDYIDFLSKINININFLNIDLFSIFITNLIVICLYLITYFIVDQKNEKARHNQKAIIRYMLEDDYKTSLRYLSILEDKKQLKLITENINRDSYMFKNEYFNNWMDVSFKNYNDIMQYSSQGLIDIEILKKYLYIRSNYSYTMSGYVLAVGMPREIESLIEEGHQNLKKVVEDELEKINTYNW